MGESDLPMEEAIFDSLGGHSHMRQNFTGPVAWTVLMLVGDRPTERTEGGRGMKFDNSVPAHCAYMKKL